MIPSGTKFVGINPNFPTAERKSAQNNAAQEVYTIEDILESATLQQVSDAGGLDNGSTIREGSKDNYELGGGISLVCSLEKEQQWENGVQYFFEVGKPIVSANSINGDTPDNTYDETKGFAVGSFYNVLSDGKTYICTDATTDNAVWLPMGGEYFPTLDGANGAVISVALSFAYYSINNGMVDVTIYGSVNVDFSSNSAGVFNFTLPIPSISNTLGGIFLAVPNQNSSRIKNGAAIYSNDTTFINGQVQFVAKFTYQAY
jgi:hypothetical protein